MAILVTGGAGFIGSHLVERLLKEGGEVVCLDNFDDYYDPKIKRRNIASLKREDNFHLAEVDIRNRPSLFEVFEQHAIGKVVHLAARAGVRPSLRDPLLYEDVNVRGTLNLLEVSKEKGIEQFIFGSSSSVYGVGVQDVEPLLPSREDFPTNPISPYAASKRSAELYCGAYHHLYHLPVTILRFFTVYGPRQRPDMAIHKFTRSIDHAEEVVLYGDGTSRRDYTHISDIIEGIMAVVRKNFDFEIVNLGSGAAVELKQLIRLIENSLDKKAKEKYLPEQPGDASVTLADISKARRLLKYRPKMEIGEGVKEFVHWFRSEHGSSSSVSV